MNDFKKVEKVAEVSRRTQATGLSVASLSRQHLGEYLDPYLMFDHFNMTQPFFKPHPHAGFSAVTYMFPHSKNGFINRDSLGNQNLIEPGAVHWTVAGKGIIHEEVPIEKGIVYNGLQIFVNLHSSKKFIEPVAFHANRNQISTVKTQASEVRIVVGEYEGQKSFFTPPTEVQLLDVIVNKESRFQQTVPEGYLGFLYILRGQGQVCSDPATGIIIHENQAAGLSLSGRKIEIRTTHSDLHFVLCLGKPLKEPVVFHGPFCMNSDEQIETVIRDFQAGKMGKLDPSF